MAKINQAMQDIYRYNAAILPQKRSRFDKSHSHSTTFDSSYLVPLMWDRVLPGDEKQIKVSALARLATPLHPTMDDAKFDMWAFYVPDRLWWENAKRFYGENLNPDFIPDEPLVMPYLTPDKYVTNVELNSTINGMGSLNDYFGFPTCDNELIPPVINEDPAFRVTAGLHRSYQLIWNEWFRNSSVQEALRLNFGDSVDIDEWLTISQIRRVCKYPDYFTTLLMRPQAGNEVSLSLGEWAPVVTRSEFVPANGHSDDGLKLGTKGTGSSYVDNSTSQDILFLQGSPSPNLSRYDHSIFTSAADTALDGVSSKPYSPMNLWADLADVSAITINNLRAAVTIQHLLEIQNTAGKRYQQLLQAMWGVFTSDATLQRPELLGAASQHIGMRQLAQTSATSEGSTPLGNLAAISVTSMDNEWICNKSFTEPGFIMILGAVRPVQSYSQGLNCLATKINQYDHYNPVFDNLGNQPVPTSELFFTFNEGYTGGNMNDPEDYKAVFGYKEAWLEYRTMQNRVSGYMRPDVPQSLASWNYSVAWETAPDLNDEFVSENPELIERTLAVQNVPQFILDCYFEYYDTKSMGIHSIPGVLRL